MDFSVVGFSRAGVDDNNYVRRHSAKTTNRVLIAGKNGVVRIFPHALSSRLFGR
jgi:hypothetical protein